MKKAIIFFITAIIVFSLLSTAVLSEGNDSFGETTAAQVQSAPYQSEGSKNKELEWLYYVIGFATVGCVIGAAVYISKKR